MVPVRLSACSVDARLHALQPLPNFRRKGKVYFVQGLVKLGVAVGRPNFKRVDEQTGRAAVSAM